MRSITFQHRLITVLSLAMGLAVTACGSASTGNDDDSLDSEAVGADEAALYKAWAPATNGKPVALAFVATYICGDGVLSGKEACDDANNVPGDGCDASCRAEDGFTCSGEPSACADVNECLGPEPICGENAVCRNVAGGYNCTCAAGYAGDGLTCRDVDECALGTNYCGENAACVNEPGGFSCVCNDGFSGDGVTCTDIDECAKEIADCSPDADCVNWPGSYECVCRDGWKGDGTYCEYMGK